MKVQSMNLQIRINILLLQIFLIVINCEAQSSRELSYGKFLSLLKNTNLLAQKAENNLPFAGYQLKAAQGNFDPQLSSSFNNKQFNSKNYFSYGSAEIKQPLYTSHYLKMGYQYGQGVSINPEFATSAIGLPYVGVEVSLLQGLLMDKRRAEIKKAKYYSDYYKDEQKIQLNELFYYASTTYMEGVYSKKINSIYAYFSNLAQQRLEGISELSKSGEKPAVDTIEAAIYLQGRLLEMQASEIELSKKNTEIQTLISSSDELVKDRIEYSDSLDQLYLSASIAIQQLLQNETISNPLLSQYIAKQKVLETELRLKRELIKPVLDVSYNFLSNDNQTYLQGFTTNAYKWGATFSFPLYFRKARNEYKMAQIAVQNNELETINKQNQFSNKRKFIVEALRVCQEQINNAEKSVNYSNLLVEAEKLKFVNGESSLFLVNARENKWLENELKLAEYKLKYLKAILELVYTDGNLNFELS